MAELEVEYEEAEIRAPVGAGVDGVAGCEQQTWSLELDEAVAAAAFVNSLVPLESSPREAAPAQFMEGKKQQKKKQENVN